MRVDTKTQKAFDELMSKIKCFVFNYEGKGFTLEIYPITANITEFKEERSGFNGKFYWKAKHIDDSERFIRRMQVEFPISLPNKIKRVLPEGISIKESSVIETILDERIHRVSTSSAVFIEGRRAFLTVSNEYASKIYMEVYTDVGLPFRDKLLGRHVGILNDISTFIELKRFEVHRDHIIAYERVEDGTNKHFILREYTFEEHGMQSLNSMGQMYGMTLAIIETLKKNFVEINKGRITIQIPNMRHTCVTFQPEEPPKPALKEW